jgi:hypothetical protein
MYESAVGVLEPGPMWRRGEGRMNDLMLDTSFTIAIGAVILILILMVDYTFRRGRKKQRN